MFRSCQLLSQMSLFHVGRIGELDYTHRIFASTSIQSSMFSSDETHQSSVRNRGLKMIRKERLERKIQELDEDERLVAESQRACDCFDIVELMRDSSALFDDLVRLDEHLREVWLKIPSRYDPKIDDDLESLFVRWHEIAGRIVSLFNEMAHDCDARGFDREHYSELMTRYQQSSSVINSSDDETCLADEAVREHHEGLTIPL